MSILYVVLFIVDLLFFVNRSKCLLDYIFRLLCRIIAFPFACNFNYKIGTGFTCVIQPVAYAILYILFRVRLQRF